MTGLRLPRNTGNKTIRQTLVRLKTARENLRTRALQASQRKHPTASELTGRPATVSAGLLHALAVLTA